MIRIAWKSRRDCLAQMVEVGFSPNCAQRIRDVSLFVQRLEILLGEDEFEIPLVGEFNVRNAAMAAIAAAILPACLSEDSRGAQEFQGNRAPAGSTRRSARRQGDRRFRSSSDRYRADPAGDAASLSRPSDMGGFRAAIEHYAARGFSAAIAGCVETGRRRFYLAGGAAGTDPGSGPTQSAKRW